jgi:hypothetical protein
MFNAVKTGTRRVARIALPLCAIALPAAAHGQANGPTITIRAAKHAYHNAPVTVPLPPRIASQSRRLSGYLMLTPAAGQSGKPLRAQAVRDKAGTRLAFVLDDLAQGESRAYRLGQVVFVRKPDRQVEVRPVANGAEISVDSGLFTRYTMTSAPNKPVFYPILTPDGTHMTRRWPVEPNANPDESHDHPHHRGLWFTHSSVNGVDFWSEQSPKVGKTVTTGCENIQSGWVCGGFAARTDWRDADGTLIATDRRDVTVYDLPRGDRVMDFSITLTPVGGPLTFGDNKDGVFGLRVPDSLAIQADRSAKIKGEGHIETASGTNDKDAWGKPNDWVDYWGPVAGKTYGVAIFDAPSNLRHPETWHARDYALFTVNPFGLHDFGRGDKGAGDYTVPADKTITFTYRLLFHHGDTKAADVAGEYAAFADPPEVSVK